MLSASGRHAAHTDQSLTFLDHEKELLGAVARDGVALEAGEEERHESEALGVGLFGEPLDVRQIDGVQRSNDHGASCALTGNAPPTALRLRTRH